MEQKFVCGTRAPGKKILPNLRNFSDGVLTCKKLKSSIHTYKTSVNLTEDLYIDTSEIGSEEMIWTGFNDSKVDGEFISTVDGVSIANTNLVWKWGEPSWSILENCSVIVELYSNLVWDVACDEKALTTCQIEKIPVFKIRGDLTDLNIQGLEESFILNMDKNLRPDQYFFQGFFGSKIEQIGQMVMKEMNKFWMFQTDQISARCKTDDLPLGTNDWEIVEQNLTTSLNLNVCDKTEFSCNNGTCIYKYGRCNKILDCPDNSDEVDCGNITSQQDSKRLIPPQQGKEP